MQPLLTIQEAMDRWVQRFAPGWLQEKTACEKTAVGRRREPWRMFQEGRFPCLKGEAARLAFNRVEKDGAIYFRPGAESSDLAAELFPGTDAAVIDCMGDIYIVDRRFTWTYVHTRYPWCGPYFARFRK